MSSDSHFRKLEKMYLSVAINQTVYSAVNISLEKGKAEIVHAVEEKFFHAANSLHGSVYFKLLDDAAYFAASSLVEDEFLFTTSFQVHFLRPVTEGSLRAKGWVEKLGRSVIIAQSVLYDERNRKVAIGQGQLMKSGKLLSDIPGYSSASNES